MQEIPVLSLGQEHPLEKSMASHSSVLAWTESHGQRSLVRYSPWGRKELVTTATNTTLASKVQNLGPLNFLEAFLWSVDPRPLLSILYLTVKLSEPLGGRIKPGPWTRGVLVNG